MATNGARISERCAVGQPLGGALGRRHQLQPGSDRGSAGRALRPRSPARTGAPAIAATTGPGRRTPRRAPPPPAAGARGLPPSGSSVAMPDVEGAGEQRAAAAPPGQGQLPAEQGEDQRAHAAPIAHHSRRRSGSGSCTAARISPPPSKCASHDLAEASCGARRPAAPAARPAATGGAARPAAGPRDSRRFWPAESLRTSSSSSGARSSCSVSRRLNIAAAQPSAPECPAPRPAVRPVFRPSWWPSRCRPAGPRQSRIPGRPQAAEEPHQAPPPGRSRPATARSRLVLPAPLAPVSATASPARSRQVEALEQRPLAARQGQGLYGQGRGSRRPSLAAFRSRRQPVQRVDVPARHATC